MFANNENGEKGGFTNGTVGYASAMKAIDAAMTDDRKQ